MCYARNGIRHVVSTQYTGSPYGITLLLGEAGSFSRAADFVSGSKMLVWSSSPGVSGDGQRGPLRQRRRMSPWKESKGEGETVEARDCRPPPSAWLNPLCPAERCQSLTVIPNPRAGSTVSFTCPRQFEILNDGTRQDWAFGAASVACDSEVDKTL